MKVFNQPLLAIETSCDETSASVIVGRRVLSNVVASQIDMHAAWGGVVPEAAARAHVEAILPTISQALSDSGVSRRELEAIAVTDRPGLVGALSVGVTAAKALSHAAGIPLIGIHHIEGHLSSVVAEPAQPRYPLLSLVVSGGHTELILLDSPLRYRMLGGTRDDAAGEALDKSARLLGLPYPGGRALSELARGGDPKRYPLPRGMGSKTFEMSFSGLKTAVLRTVQAEGDALNRAGLAASVEASVVGALLSRVILALEEHEVAALAVVGGVAANSVLRAALMNLGEKRGLPVFCPPAELCTDNAAMIGLAASLRLGAGETSIGDIEPRATAPLPGLIA